MRWVLQKSHWKVVKSKTKVPNKKCCLIKKTVDINDSFVLLVNSKAFSNSKLRCLSIKMKDPLSLLFSYSLPFPSLSHSYICLWCLAISFSIYLMQKCQSRENERPTSVQSVPNSPTHSLTSLTSTTSSSSSRFLSHSVLSSFFWWIVVNDNAPVTLPLSLFCIVSRPLPA